MRCEYCGPLQCYSCLRQENAKLRAAAEKACWVLEKCVIQFWEGLDSELPQLITRTEMDQALAVLTECGITPKELCGPKD